MQRMTQTKKHQMAKSTSDFSAELGSLGYAFSNGHRLPAEDGDKEIRKKRISAYFEIALSVLKKGEKALCEKGLRLGTRLPKFSSSGHSEIEGVNELYHRIQSYLNDSSTIAPFNVCVLAPPGGGKSTVVKKLNKAICEMENPEAERMTYLEFNASQYESVEDFRKAWRTVRLNSNKQPVLCFIDEFDVGPGRWFGHYLAVTNDGGFFDPDLKEFGGKVVFIFGGGVFGSRAEIEASATHLDKLPDFLRRMDAYLDLTPIGFPWDHPQLGHPTLNTPVLSETMKPSNHVLGFVSKTVTDRTGNSVKLDGDSRVPDYVFHGERLSQSMPQEIWDQDSELVRWQKPHEMANFDLIRTSGTASASGPNSPPLDYDLRPNSTGPIVSFARMVAKVQFEGRDKIQFFQDRELFFALVKRALTYRFIIKNAAEAVDVAHGTLINTDGEEWIEDSLARVLLHPAARFRAGLGSIDKFVNLWDIAGKQNLDWSCIPALQNYSHLIAYGPQHFAIELEQHKNLLKITSSEGGGKIKSEYSSEYFSALLEQEIKIENDEKLYYCWPRVNWFETAT